MSCRIHLTPGRIRVRLNDLKNDMPSALITDLEQLNGVQRVLPTEATGSILVYFNEAVTSSRSLMRVFRMHGHLENIALFPSVRPDRTQVRVNNPGFLDVIQQLFRRAVRPS